MKHFVLSLYGKLIAAVLTFIGIVVTACVEYGSPYAHYIVKGKVTDSHSQKPIAGINVIYKVPGSSRGIDTVRTDADGNYQLKTDWILDNAWLYAEDLDGETNGGPYTPDSLRMGDMVFKQIKKGDGRWFEGVFEKKDADFSLRINKVTPIPMYGIPSAEFKNKEK